MDKSLLDTYKKVALDYYANDNSLHKLGYESKKLEDSATKQIIDVLGLNNKEIIYTSGGVEACNLCIIGYLSMHNKKHVIVESGVDSSIILSLEHMKKFGYYYDVVDKFSLDYLTDQTILICFKNDSIDDFDIKGIATYIDIRDCNIANINKYSFISIDGIDVEAFTGIGCLVKNKNIVLEPIIHGGKSTTVYRSGTPVLPFIVTFAKAIKIKYKS